MRKIVYFHGFNSSKPSPNSGKDLLLKGLSETIYIDYSETSYKFDDVFECIDSQLKKLNINYFDHIFIGSSLGGFYSLLFSRLYDVPTILLNPAIKSYLSLKKYTGKTIEKRNGKGHINLSESDLVSYKHAYDSYINREYTNPTSIICNKDDEVLDMKLMISGTGINDVTWSQYGDHRYINQKLLKMKFNEFILDGETN